MVMNFGNKGFRLGKKASKSDLLLSLPLTADLLGKVAGGVTFSRASAQWGTDDNGALVQVANNVPFFNSKGVLCEPASTNKCTCYGAIPADTLGAELVTNGSFTGNATGWTLDTGWAYGSNNVTATAAASTVNCYRPIAVTKGKWYRVTFTISGYTSGGVAAKFYGTAGTAGTTRAANGTFVEDIFLSGTGASAYNGNAGIITVGTTTLTVDDISIKELTAAIGTKSFYDSGAAAWVQNHTNMTLASTDTANPPTLTTVDGTADLTAAGLLSISQSGKWYQAVNPAGAVATAQVRITGNTGNTNNHSYFVIGKQTGGAFLSTLDAGVDGVHNINLPAAVGKVMKENAAIPVSTGIYVGLPPGATAWFFLPQLEELPACTSPMPCQGATATRAATVISFPVAGNTKANDFTISFEATLNSTAPSTQNIFSSGATSGSGFLVAPTGGASISCIKFIAGASKSSGITTGFVAGVSKKVIFRVSSTSGETTFAGGVKGASVDADTSNITYSGTTVTVGSYQAAPAASPFYGYIKNIKIYKTATFTDSQCNAMSA